jgi:hypothetical protein
MDRFQRKQSDVRRIRPRVNDPIEYQARANDLVGRYDDPVIYTYDLSIFVVVVEKLGKIRSTNALRSGLNVIRFHPCEA